MGRRDEVERALVDLPACSTGEVTAVEPVARPGAEVEATLDAADRATLPRHLAAKGKVVESPLPPRRISAEVTVSAIPGEGEIESYLQALPARFVVQRVLGRGGMGIVIAARDRTLQRDVAIKMIVADNQNPLARERFLREARAAAPLRHRGIVQVFDIDPDGKYIVMELVRGESLAARLEREPRLPVADVRRIGDALAEALGVAHAAGIVHRDVKPANILLGESGDVKLADFGVALFGNSELTAPGAQVGTPAYMAPEQLRGNETDARADIYAAGATLFRAATGHGLHDHAGPRDVAAEVFETTADRMLADVIARAVRDDPAERFANGRALRVALSGGTRAFTLRPRDAGRASWARFAVLSTIAAAVLGAGTWVVAREYLAAKPAGPAATSPIGLIAVEPLHWTTWSYAAKPPSATASGDVLAMLLDQIDGLHAAGATELTSAAPLVASRDGGWPDAARALQAGYLVDGTFEQRGKMFHAVIHVLALAKGTATTFEIDNTTIPELMNDAAERVARSIDPHKTLSRVANAQRARQFFARGEPSLARLDFAEARPFLDQAVTADPSYFEAWYALASVRSWMLAPSDEVTEAIDAANRNATAGPKKQLLEGASRFLHHDYRGARAVLEPLVGSADLGKLEQRDVLYYLGEAHWHDGHHDIAVGYFRRALELDTRFKPPVIHLGEYALGRRDDALAIYANGLLEGSNDDSLEFSRGHYDALERTGTTGFRLYAALVLGKTLTPELAALAPTFEPDATLFRIARAFGDGDDVGATQAIEAYWSAVLAKARDSVIPDSTYHSLSMLADILLCAGDAEQARRIVTFMAERSRSTPVRGYQRISILAAPLVGDRSLIVRDGLTDREQQLADAIEAEMSGNRARAVDLLAKLVADPTSSWDFPERMALLRNLRALGRTRQARDLCADTRRPAMFAWAFLPARRQCLR